MHMCFECAEVFDTKEELANHTLTHKLEHSKTSATPENKTVCEMNVSLNDTGNISVNMSSPVNELNSTVNGSNDLSFKHSATPSPISNHYDDKNSSTLDFSESLNSIQFDMSSITQSSSLFDEYMRARGLDGPELGLPSIQSTMKADFNSMVPKKQFTVTVTNSDSDSDYKYICPVCGKCYIDKDLLSKHLETHAGFICTVCGKSYTTKSNLQTHMRKHNGDKPYNCNFCDKSFTSHCVLKVHHRTHTGEKPFACPTCGVSFAKNIHLKRHLSIHTGIKPHECKVCNKRFSRSDHLKRHVQSIHTQDRPHICSLCGKDFVRKYELNKHMKQLHWGFTVGEDGNDSLDASNSTSLLTPSGASPMDTSDANVELKPQISLLNSNEVPNGELNHSPEKNMKSIVNIKTEKV